MKIRILLLFIAMALPGRIDAATLKGSVKDLGLLDSPSPGIPGVTVTVQSSDGKQIASSLTDTQGHYQIEKLPQAKLRISYERLGYRERPAVRDVTLRNAPLELEVLLIQESESLAYNDNVAKVIQSQVDDNDSYVELVMVNKLKPSQRSLVLGKLEASKGTVWLKGALASAGQTSHKNIG